MKKRNYTIIFTSNEYDDYVDTLTVNATEEDVIKYISSIMMQNVFEAETAPEYWTQKGLSAYIQFCNYHIAIEAQPIEESELIINDEYVHFASMEPKEIFAEFIQAKERNFSDKDIEEMMDLLKNNGINILHKISVKHHYEPSWEDMYKYLCENNDLEEAMELSKNVNDYEDIYVCENGACILFYEILI